MSQIPGTQVYTVVDSPLGAMVIAATGEAVTGVWFHDRLSEEKVAGLGVLTSPDASIPIATAVTQLEEYFDGERHSFEVPLAPSGTPHQQQVWQLLLGIGYGSTATYGELARQRGIPAGAQSVGQAVGRNPISVIIPCHRVVGSGGVHDLTGYAGGLERKQFLLELEGILPTPLIP